MVIVNFAHPLTRKQLDVVKRLTGAGEVRVIDVGAQFDAGEAFAPQARSLADSAGLTAVAWQSERVLLNLPSLNHIAALLLAELHGRMGYFPSILRLRQAPGITPPEFEVAEIIDLQAARDAARGRR
jgi:hypothetical protein